MVVQSIDKESSNMQESLSIISQIQWLMEKFEEMSVYHSFKKANRCADALADIGCSIRSDCVYFDSPPNSLLSILNEDSKDISTSRMVCM